MRSGFLPVLVVCVWIACLSSNIGCQSGARVQTYELDPPVLKPSGEPFKFWKNETTFARTYYADAQSPAASDDNPGTAEQPFKTIGKAARVLEPGENVVVRAGVYRETIRPARGGESPARMIGYHAEGDVVVKGSEIVAVPWESIDPAANIWSLDLSSIAFIEDSPFDQDNLPEASFKIMDWASKLRGKVPFTLPRGMVFQDGKRLLCVATREELQQHEGSHWTDRTARRLYIQPFAKANPNGVVMEVTTRSAGLRPAVRGLGFVQVKGFTFEQFSNGFPRPQEGAISVGAGHHWLIEDNTVRQANGIGIDIGTGWYGGSVKPAEPGDERAEWNVVRQNLVTDTGVCGIAGYPATNALIEDNVLINSTLYPRVEPMYESAGIKTHHNTDTLIRRNLIVDSAVNGIWMDWDNRDTRCTENVVVNSKVGIFIEASVRKPYSMIDRNVVWKTREGLIEQDSRNQTFVNNFVGESNIGVNLKGKVSSRPITPFHWTTAGGNVAKANAFWNTQNMVRSGPTPKNRPQQIADNVKEAQGAAASYDAARGVIILQTPPDQGPFAPATQPTEIHFSSWKKWPGSTKPVEGQ